MRAGFRDVKAERVDAPLRMGSAAECLRFERESFGALQQMLSGLDDAGKQAAWQEIAQELAKFETAEGLRRSVRNDRRGRRQVGDVG